ncbi:MAG: Rne/Rng family ribonuclease [Myxococcota bacterium]|nr:Rne/Rng family ribonuclease [Myxococcota bacterium]
MANSLVINCSPHETRIGVIENNKVVELMIERRKTTGLLGNIYKGRVTRVLPGMQAAFVDIGLERAAFLYVADVTDARRSRSSSNSVSDTRAESYHPPIQNLLHEGQEIMVQVSKEPLGTKGARVTSNVSIAGRHLVYMPTVEHVGISRRISDEEERRRLREALETLVPQGGGFVARTAAEGRSLEELGADVEFLSQVWNDIVNRMENSAAPVTLYDDLDLLLRSARDLVMPDLEEIVIDDEVEFSRLLDFMRRFMPRYAERVVRFDGDGPIFDHYGVEIELNRALSRKVWLPSGGYLIIDQTEALTAIDVNTGRFVGKRNLSETILKTNVEAVTEVVRQLRLRNIGGIIVIDFIDMESPNNRHRVYADLELALESDRARTNILKISELGLVEMTRKRVRESLVRSVSESCFYCDGTGLLKSRTTIAHEVYRTLLREGPSMRTKTIRVSVHPRVSTSFHADERVLIDELESRLERTIRLESRSDFHIEHFEISAIDQSEMVVGRKITGSAGDR